MLLMPTRIEAAPAVPARDADGFDEISRTLTRDGSYADDGRPYRR